MLVQRVVHNYLPVGGWSKHQTLQTPLDPSDGSSRPSLEVSFRNESNNREENGHD